jgi:hypothetical protein
MTGRLSRWPSVVGTGAPNMNRCCLCSFSRDGRIFSHHRCSAAHAVLV